MKHIKTYCFILFGLLFMEIATAFSDDIFQAKQIDSLLNDSKNRVYEKPDESIELGLSIFEDKNNSLTARTRALMLVSLGYTSKRDYQKALDYIIRANELSSEINDAKLELEILFMIGINYQQLKIYDKSIEYMEKVEREALLYPVYDSVGKYLANSYIVKGFIYKDNLNCDIALEFFKKGIREYEKLKYQNSNANTSIAYYNKGNCYILLSDYENAKNSFYESIKFAELENANSLISFAQKGLAEVYTLEGEYEKSISLLNLAYEKSKNVGDLVLNQAIFKGLFENYLALNEWDDYQKYYDLYSKTQLDIKKSERSSVSNSIDKVLESQITDLNEFEKRFKGRLKWIYLLVFLLLVATFFIERKNIKTIKTLHKEVEKLQKSK